MRMMKPLQMVLGVWLMCSLVGCQTAGPASRVSYPITITNNAALNPDSTNKKLVATQTVEGEPLEYAVDVRSVYCLDDECEIITVRLYWNALGVYQRYEIPAGKNLTKNEHTRFSREDHRTLHALLQDSQSLVQYVQPNELLEAERENTKSGAGPQQFAWRNPEYALKQVDAVSTPTPVDLQSLVVPGAAYTSLTLWHWAHGEVPENIRRITRETASRRQLMQWLDDEDPHHVRFALEALADRRMYDEATVAAVLNRCKRQDGDWIKPAWPFLTGATTNRPDRLAVYTTLLREDIGPQRVFLLEQLAREKQISTTWFNALAACVSHFESYYEIHLFLNLLSERKVRTQPVIEAVITLLDRPNAYVTRRVCQFLSKLPASEQIASALVKYRASHAVD